MPLRQYNSEPGIKKSEKGTPHGIATLNAEGIVPDEQLPDVVEFARQIETDDAQSSRGTFVTRTSGGSSNIADGDAWLETIRGNMIRTGYSPRVVRMTVTPVMVVPRVGTLTAVIDPTTWVESITSSGVYTFNYMNGWNVTPASVGITVTGVPENGDEITVDYTTENFETTINGEFTIEIDHDTWTTEVTTSDTIEFSYTDSWDKDLTDYGITVTGTPVDGDSISIVYTKQDIDLTVDAVETMARQNPIVAIIDEEAYDNAISENGTMTFTYDGTNGWDSAPASYGITVTNTPVDGDEISVVCTKEVRGTITVFEPEEFYSTNWNLYNHTLGYARVLHYKETASFILGGTFTAGTVKFSTTNDPSATKTDVVLVDNLDGTYSFEVDEDGFVWLEGGNEADTYILMTWTDWTAGLPADHEFEPHTASTIDLTGLIGTGKLFSFGLAAIGEVHDMIDLSIETAYKRIERISYSTLHLEQVRELDVDYIYDADWIYYVSPEPSIQPISLNGAYTVNDHGLEVFTGTFVPGTAEMLYGHNLVDKLRTDVLTISAQSLTAAQREQVWDNLQIPVQTMRDVPFAIATTDWTSSNGVYRADFTSQYITADSKEFAIYDNTIRTAAKGDINVEKTTVSNSVVMRFTTNRMPTSTIAGKFYVWANDDNKVPTIIENTVVGLENGGTGQSSLAGAQQALGITALNEKITKEASVDLSSCSTLEAVFNALLSTSNWIGYGGVGNNENTNLRTLLGNSSQGAYVNCVITIISKSGNNYIAQCTATNVISDGGIKTKYLKKCSSYYGQNDWA